MFRMMFILAGVLLGLATPAQAYVGPGSSLGAVGGVLGLIGTLILALISFVWYPLRRSLRRIRRGAARFHRSNR